MNINNIKKILFILSLVLLVGCNDQNIKESQTKNEQPQTTVIESDNIQYDIKWNNNNVDIRIVTLSKDDESHDYVVSTAYVYKGGGIDIDHWSGCKCFKNK